MKYDNLIEPNFDDIIMAEYTGDILQDNDTLGFFAPKKNQIYFIYKANGEEFVVGLRDLLLSLAIAEEKGQIPPLENEWWRAVTRRYQIE